MENPSKLTCPTCRGNGYTWVLVNNETGQPVSWEDDNSTKCETCNGEGNIPNDPSSMEAQTLHPSKWEWLNKKGKKDE